MANEYSVEIHTYLTEKIAEAEESMGKNVLTDAKALGQIEELLWIREYLRDNIDLKDFNYY